MGGVQWRLETCLRAAAVWTRPARPLGASATDVQTLGQCGPVRVAVRCGVAVVERFNFSAALTADGRRRIVKLRLSETAQTTVNGGGRTEGGNAQISYGKPFGLEHHDRRPRCRTGF